MAVETILYTTLRGDSEPVEELPAEIINYGYRLNRPGQLSFTLALDHPFCTRTIVGPGTHEAVVVRNRQIVWRGPVLTARETDSKTDRKVEFGAEGLLQYLNRWALTQDVTFTAVDQFTILKTLVDTHQAKAGGGFNIGTTTITTSGVTRDRTYLRGKNVGEAALELASVLDGFDFGVDPDTRELEAFYPQQGTLFPDLIIEDGIRSYTRSIDATAQASQLIGIGQGEGSDQVFATRQDSSAVGDYGLTQRVYNNQEVSNLATLITHLDYELAYHAEPVQDLAITVGTSDFNPFEYGLGVSGRVRYSSSFEAVNQVRRLIGFDVVWNSGDEQAVLALAPVVNL
jgi:hypothetical protein